MTLKTFCAIATFGLLAACVSTKAPSSPSNYATLTSQECNAEQVKLMGQTANEANLKKAQEQAGANKIRLMLPDRMYTTDYDETRLSIRVDTNNIIQNMYCG